MQDVKHDIFIARKVLFGDVMNEQLMNSLRKITAEEQSILMGRDTIDRTLYMESQENRINAEKLLAAGKMITLRTHTRFIHFPEHTHDYVEVVYMCEGKTTHIVSGIEIPLKKGELLFLSQSVTHEIKKAEENDVAVNFIVLPEFFSKILDAMGEEETPLRKFLVDCLCARTSGPGYLHFKVSELVPVQNLIENLLYTLMNETPNKRKVSQMTMTLLFLELVGHMDTLCAQNQDQAVLIEVLSYIESHYASGSLSEIASLLHYDLYWLSREIKRKTGKTYTQLVQEKRLAQAAFLLKTTDRNVDEIAGAVGYENMGYFHRIFKEMFQMSPKHYRSTQMQIR